MITRTQLLCEHALSQIATALKGCHVVIDAND